MIKKFFDWLFRVFVTKELPEPEKSMSTIPVPVPAAADPVTAGLTLATTPFPGATWACPHGERRSTPLCIQRPPKGYSRMPKGEVT